MSSSRQVVPLIAYSLSPSRKSVRVIVTSAPSIGSRPEELSMVRLTSARPSAGRVGVPEKITSSMRALRRIRVLWAPRTQVTASTTLDLPDPLGPTTDGHVGLELQRRGVGERLEALHREALQEHDADATNAPRGAPA